MKINISYSPNRKRGFALIATISVMVLLVLIALAMLSLASIELRQKGNSDALEEARANARLGLMVAIGELQKTLGPDARATANSSILDTVPSTEVIDGVTHKHWLGVYPTINPENPDENLLSPEDFRAWSIANMEWLVSSEDAANLDPRTSINGEAITLAQFITDPLVEIPDNDSIESLSPDQLSRAQVGLVRVGIDASGNHSGSYGWMAFDENMKARIDALASEDGSDVLDGTIVNADDQETSNYQTIQGNNLNAVVPGYKDEPEFLDKVISGSQLSLLGEQTTGSDWTNWEKLNRDKFTPYSRSLPVDVTNGKLKQDLTAYLKGNFTGLDGQSMIDSRFNIAATKQPMFDSLKQWANLIDDHTAPQPVVAPDSTNPNSPRAGLHPVVTQGAVALQYCYRPLTATTMNPVIMIQPQFQLLNPHNVPLAAQDYIIQIGYQWAWVFEANSNSAAFMDYTPNSKPTWRSWQQVDGMQPLPIHKPASNEQIDYQENKRFFTFVIKNQAFEAGESLIFFASPPQGAGAPQSGTPYNMATDAETDILNNYTSPNEQNLLVNEGSLDEFFYIIHPTVASNVRLTSGGSPLDLLAYPGPLKYRVNFQSQVTGVTNLIDLNDLDMHINLYSFQEDEPNLLHAIRHSQRNTRFGNSSNRNIDTYPLEDFQNGSRLAFDTLTRFNPIINFGTALLANNQDIFNGGASNSGANSVNPPPRAGQSHASLGYWNIRSQENFSAPEGLTASTPPDEVWLNTFAFRDELVFRATWATAQNLYSNLSTDRLGGWFVSGVQDTIYPFFDYPTESTGPASLGSFQHADLSPYSWQPTYAFGNAQAAPRIDRNQFRSTSISELYDVSYLLNASTWDGYYLSTIPQSGVALTSNMRLPNSRLTLVDDIALNSNDMINQNGFNRSAANVMIEGGFNVNSTSKSAWVALLSGALGETIDTIGILGTNTQSHSADAAAMGRFLRPIVEEPDAIIGDRVGATAFDEASGWASTRTLDESEIDILATRIVEEVKQRGPFLSLADFVNRRISTGNDVTGDDKVYQEVLGTLQAAINKATANDNAINAHFYSNGIDNIVVDLDDVWTWGSLSLDVDDESKESMFGYPISEIDSKGANIHNYAPNFLSQADVLTKIGPSITVRGDTFVIRAYGDSVDPSTGEVRVKAWCEAVVQRVATPVDWDGVDTTKLIQPQAPTETGFGRDFKMVSFRWLTESDIMPFSNDESITN